MQTTRVPVFQYVYRARLVRVVDGDTAVLEIALGFYLSQTMRCRFSFLNAPERGTPEGTTATAFTTQWFNGLVGEWPLLVLSNKMDDYGRPLVTIWRVSDSACLNNDLLASGHAVPYPTPKL